MDWSTHWKYLKAVLSLVGALAVKALGHVAVVAKDLKAGRVVVSFQPTNSFTDLATVCAATPVDMIDSEELDRGLATTCTARDAVGAVREQGGEAQLGAFLRTDTDEVVGVLASSPLVVALHAVLAPVRKAVGMAGVAGECVKWHGAVALGAILLPFGGWSFRSRHDNTSTQTLPQVLYMHWRYGMAVLRHKWFVLIMGLRYTDTPIWRLLIHDWSKFTPAEWGPYARAFYGAPRTKTGKPEGDVAFDHAWLHHQWLNKHHWQAWVHYGDSGIRVIDVGMMLEDSGNRYWLTDQHEALQPGDGELLTPLPMPLVYLEEMLADWLGANRAYGDQPLSTWYRNSQKARLLDPQTKRLVEARLRQLIAIGACR